MKITLQFDTSGIDWGEAARIFELAPLGTRHPETLQQSSEGSSIVRFAKENGRLVGMARAVSDGVLQAAIYDVCMLPEYQGRGVGRKIMEAVMARLEADDGCPFCRVGQGKVL